MKRIFIVVIIVMLTAVNFMSFIPQPTESKEINNIVDGGQDVTENTLEIADGGGTDKLGEFSLRYGVPVTDAYFNLTATANAGGQYPVNVHIDVGNDGIDDDTEYQFRGIGYGAWGQQTVFSDNNTRKTYSFTSPAGGSDDSGSVLLPKTAEVQSAEVKVTGSFLQVVDKTVIDSTHNDISEVHPADMDNDGDIDVVVAGNNELVWYNNTNGIGTSWQEHKINGSQSGAAAVYVFDIDNDNDSDVVSVSRVGGGFGTGPVIYYRNLDGKARTWNTTIVNNSKIAVYNIEAADMDNDGDGDIVLASGDWAGGATGVYWYNNTDGNGSSWTENVVASNFNRCRGLSVFDVDDDGDNDTVVSRSWPRTISWIENQDGKANTWSNPKTIGTPSSSGNPFNIAKGDIDDDGDTDIAVATSVGVFWFQQPSNLLLAWNMYRVSTFTAWWGGDVAIADVGNPGLEPDGDLDILAVTQANDDDVMWYVNDGTPAASNWEVNYINGNHVDATSIRVADIDNQNYTDIVVGSAGTTSADDLVWYKLNGSFPSNVRLDLGGDTTNDWSYASWLKTTEHVANLAANFQNLVDSAPIAYTDQYYNDFVELDFKVLTNTGGRVRFTELQINYDYHVKVTGKTGRSLANEIHEHTGDAAPGNVTIPIMVKAYSGGKITISDIVVVFNDYPTPIPIEGFGLDEDTRNNSLIDLTQYFTDDYLNPSALTYSIIDFTNATIVDVFINDDFYLGVDAETGPNNNNWYGYTEVTVAASDDMGLEMESEPFFIEIIPVNDEPIVGAKKIPDIAINEGGKSPSLDLDADDFFEDVDSTNLFYDFEIDPLNEAKDEQLNASIDPVTKMLTVEAYGDWFTPVTTPLRFRLYCDDDTGDINLSNAYQDIFITVNNLDDDAPVWSPIPDVVMNEDEKKDDAFNLFTYISDVDNAPESLKFSILHVNNNKILVDIDGNSNVDIRSEENYFGTAKVDLRASDGTNVGTTSFNIIVQNVNDQPEVELLAPRDDAFVFSDIVELQWKGTDVDPGDTANLTYSVYLDKNAGTTLYKSGITDNTLMLTGLTDKSVYYWKVIPNDGIEDGLCISDPCPSEFTVDIGQKPDCELQLPGDEAVTNLDYVVLIWKGFGEEGYQITYDVYFSNASFEFPFPESTLIEQGISDTELLVDNLTAGETYYWTVIPQTAKGLGSCRSGIWTFQYDPSITPYKFEIDAPEILRFEEGKTYSTAIKIKNTGANTDIFVPSLDAGTLKFAVVLEGVGDEFRIEDGDEQILILNISADRIPVGTYEITIKAESIGASKTQDSVITLEIFEKKEEEKGLANVYLFIIPIILIVIIIIVVVFFMMRKKRIEEDKKRVEAELLKPLPSQMMDASDVQYIAGPGGPAVSGPAQLPSVTLPGGAQAGAAQYPGQPYPYGAGQPELPQLPPAQDGAAQAPYPPATQPMPQQPTGYPPQQPAAYPPQQPEAYPPQQPAYTETAPIPPQQPPTQPQTQAPPQELQFKMPMQEQPAQPAAAPQTGAAPQQVPYIPKSHNGDAPEQPAASTPEQAPEPPSQTPEQMQNTLKARFFQGTVSEETYMTLKKELKDVVQSGGSADVLATRFITGEITEDEFKQQRGL